MSNFAFTATILSPCAHWSQCVILLRMSILQDLLVVYEVLEVWDEKNHSNSTSQLAYNTERDLLRVYLTSVALGLKKEAIRASKVFFTFYFWLCEGLRTWNGGSTCDPIIGYWIVEMGWLLSSLWRHINGDNCLPLIEREWETNKNRYSSTHHLYW